MSVVLDCLSENIYIETQGACDQKTLFEILVKAASNGDSIENTTKVLNSSLCGSDIRYHLDKINNFEQLEDRFSIQGYDEKFGFFLGERRKLCLK
ncbi:MAG: hypothetical protein V7K77_10270 [Nostoc sp.]|uniref:hypothetical protein n=1 Tax=Nostoc sp. TaxID=1180 RepID=UPI002FF7EEA2